MKIKLITIHIMLAFIMVLTVGCNTSQNSTKNNLINDYEAMDESQDILNIIEGVYSEGGRAILTKEELKLEDSDGQGKKYTFKYCDEVYTAIYTKDNWHINDSYKIKNKKDIIIICEALINVHPIHGADMQSWRSPEDMMYEWVQHNLAYEYLPESSEWKIRAKDVDLNPEDQGKSMREMFNVRMDN